MERERLLWWLHTLRMTQQYCLASMAARLSSTGISYRHLPPQSPPSHPHDPSLCSQQQPLPWDCSTVPKHQLPTIVPCRGPASLSRVCMVVARTVWFSFHLGFHRSAVSLSVLNVSPLTQLPQCRDQTPASVPPPAEGRSRPTNFSVFSPNSFVLLSFAWFYICFSSGWVLLSVSDWSILPRSLKMNFIEILFISNET